MLEEKLARARLLIVDDEEADVLLLRRILENGGYTDIRSTNDPAAAAGLIEQIDPDLILLDLLMPVMSGYEVLQIARAMTPEDDYRPVLVLTADHRHDAKHRALSSGARDFLTKPFSPTEVRLRVRNLLETRFLHQQLQQHNELLEARVAARTAELEEARIQMLMRLARAAEFRDDNTGEHTKRVGRTSSQIARELGMDPEGVETMRLAAPLHDVGKIGIPDSILLCADVLSPDQFEVMKTHCAIGADLLSGTEVPLLEFAAEIALSHHERWDGVGYPRRLMGEAIPLSGRIVAVADAWDALTSWRPYKPAWPERDALAELEGKAGTQFDPRVVDAFRDTRRARAAAGD
jgi:putative two-component system response regulator